MSTEERPPFEVLVQRIGALERLTGQVSDEGLALISDINQNPQTYYPMKEFVRPLEYYNEIYDRFPGSERRLVETELFPVCFECRTRKFRLPGEPDVAVPPSHGGLLIASSPRAGNTLFQRIVASSLGMPAIGAHHFEDIRLRNVDGPSIYQIHVGPKAAEPFVEKLGLNVVSVTRHPLDILVSVLHFARKGIQIEYWLDGTALPDGRILKGALPTDRRFVDWATSDYAAALLAVSHQWSSHADALMVRYEDMIANPVGVVDEVARLLNTGIEPDRESVHQVLESANKQTLNDHFWRGRAGNWRSLILPEDAALIYQAHRRVFDDLGYAVEDTELSAAEANRNYGSR